MDRKESVKLSFFVCCMIIYVENRKKSIIKLSELIRELRKITRYKVYTHKSYFHTV